MQSSPEHHVHHLTATGVSRSGTDDGNVAVESSGRRTVTTATGRSQIERAMRQPMTAKGWKPRALGWFTHAVSTDTLGVVTIGTASEHYEPGTAAVFPFVGLRHEVIEPLVSQLSGTPDHKYRQRTAVNSLGYLLPAQSWRSWNVAEADAGEVALHLADLIAEFALPALQRLSADPDKLLRWVERNPDNSQVTGACRVPITLELLGRRSAALAAVDQSEDALASRTDAAAQQLRPAMIRTRDGMLSRTHLDA